MGEQYNAYPIARRDILKTIGLGVAVGTLGVGTMSRPGAAATTSIETLYLTDSGGDNGGSFLTKLYEVELDSGTSQANLTQLTELTDNDFDQVDAIAASLDGTTVYMVDKNSKHLGTYDVGADTFTDEGVISGLPDGTVLASFSPTGELFVASQSTNKIYTVDVSGPTATELVAVSGATIQGADIAFDADEVLYLYTSNNGQLYTVDYDSSSPDFGVADLVGGPGDSFTGLAVRDAGNGAIVGSNTTTDQIVEVNKSTGAQDATFDMYLDGSRYAYGFGDMTVGALDVCTECVSDELLAKYEFACVEEVDDECVAYDFVLESGDGSVVSYSAGDFVSKEGEDWEPVSATFETDYCSVYAVVKAGRELEVQELTAVDGEVTVSYVDPYAISFAAFYCTEEAANNAASAFPSGGSGNNRGRGGR